MSHPEISPKDIITFEDGDPRENPWVIAGKPKIEEIKIELERPALFEGDGRRTVLTTHMASLTKASRTS